MNKPTIYDDGTYLEHSHTWHAEDSLWKAQHIADLLRRNQLDPASICEVGCGAGEILNSLSNTLGNGIQHYGYEISPQAFRICQGKSSENLHFYLEDILSLEGEPFDVVMAIDVFEHVEDYMGFLKPHSAHIHLLARNALGPKTYRGETFWIGTTPAF